MDGVKLDLKDKKILFELDFHARDSNASIAKKVRLSKQGVDYRIRRLIKKGIIDGFIPIINGNQLGYFYGRVIVKMQNLTHEKENMILKELLTDRRFNWVIKNEGAYDLGFAAWTKTLSACGSRRAAAVPVKNRPNSPPIIWPARLRSTRSINAGGRASVFSPAMKLHTLRSTRQR